MPGPFFIGWPPLLRPAPALQLGLRLGALIGLRVVMAAWLLFCASSRRHGGLAPLMQPPAGEGQQGKHDNGFKEHVRLPCVCRTEPRRQNGIDYGQLTGGGQGGQRRRRGFSVSRHQQDGHHQKRQAEGGRDECVAGGGMGHVVRSAHEKVCNIDFCAGP